MRERTITVYTFSKSFSMTGWRIGYVVAPEPFMGFIRKLVLNSVNGVSTPTQYAATDHQNWNPIARGTQSQSRISSWRPSTLVGQS